MVDENQNLGHNWINDYTRGDILIILKERRTQSQGNDSMTKLQTNILSKMDRYYVEICAIPSNNSCPLLPLSEQHII